METSKHTQRQGAHMLLFMKYMCCDVGITRFVCHLSKQMRVYSRHSGSCVTFCNICSFRQEHAQVPKAQFDFKVSDYSLIATAGYSWTRYSARKLFTLKKDIVTFYDDKMLWHRISAQYNFKLLAQATRINNTTLYVRGKMSGSNSSMHLFYESFKRTPWNGSQ